MAPDPRSIFAALETSAVVDSARALLDKPSEERLLSVDRGWMRMGHGGWEAQRRAEIIMRLVTSLRIAHDNCPSDVFWPTPQQEDFDQERRELAASRGRNGGAPGRDHRGGGGDSGHGGSDRRSSGGNSSGGGSGRDGDSHRRTGGG